MSFESDYLKLISLAKGLIFKNKSSLNEYDLVNDAFINFHESDIEYSFNAAKKIISTYIINNSRENGLIVEFGVQGDSEGNYLIKSSTSKFCKCCNEDLPNAAFHYLYNSRTKKQDLSTYCKECHRKKEKEYRIRIGKYKFARENYEYGYTSGTPSEKNKQRVAKYVNKNREKWNAYNRERYAQKKAAQKTKGCDKVCSFS